MNSVVQDKEKFMKSKLLILSLASTALLCSCMGKSSKGGKASGKKISKEEAAAVIEDLKQKRVSLGNVNKFSFKTKSFLSLDGSITINDQKLDLGSNYNSEILAEVSQPDYWVHVKTDAKYGDEPYNQETYEYVKDNKFYYADDQGGDKEYTVSSGSAVESFKSSVDEIVESINTVEESAFAYLTSGDSFDVNGLYTITLTYYSDGNGDLTVKGHAPLNYSGESSGVTLTYKGTADLIFVWNDYCFSNASIDFDYIVTTSNNESVKVKMSEEYTVSSSVNVTYPNLSEYTEKTSPVGSITSDTNIVYPN